VTIGSCVVHPRNVGSANVSRRRKPLVFGFYADGSRYPSPRRKQVCWIASELLPQRDTLTCAAGLYSDATRERLQRFVLEARVDCASRATLVANSRCGTLRIRNRRQET
jgi:hypothetical protein